MPDDTDSSLPLEQALDWFIRLQADDADEVCRQACSDWCAADPRNARAWDLTQGMWASPLLTEALASIAPPDVMPSAGPASGPPADAAMPAPVPQPRRSRSGNRSWSRQPARRRTMGRLAKRAAAWGAVALFAVVLGWAADLPLRLQADHRTATGMQERVVLADGSRVLMDTGTALAADVDETERSTRLLRGAAFFEVTPDPTRPFRITAGPAVVTVVGTAFAVRYLDDRVTVTVRHGTVDVARPGSPAVRLRAGEEVAVTATAIGAGHPADLAAALGWVDGRLVFEDRPLGEVLGELDRYHPGLIVVPDSLASRRITGNYRLDDPVRTAASLAELVRAEMLRVSDALLILRPRS
ncbi:iron dicitrate transport regulator FecR (plasmid) [Azospirillum humicireducens]|uniref:Iron dicitrate transport regulator FecR n=1 Tax=Azospirillum humicireducens TaxID=1226968 RepID=A0A2R4VSZ9_9PROT|nr:FecR domain-containing protein [Azospirillum humicireducens]AWB07531.1 iron dicitrate transport regulator FecR [Azospirillum humicireducens]